MNIAENEIINTTGNNGRFEQINIGYNPIITNTTTINYHRSVHNNIGNTYSQECKELVKAKNALLKNGKKLRTFYCLTKEEVQYLKKIHKYNPTAKLLLKNDIQLIPITQEQDSNIQNIDFAKVNIFLFTKDKDQKVNNDDNEDKITEIQIDKQGLNVLKVCANLGIILNTNQEQIHNKITGVTVRGEIAPIIYELMKQTYIGSIDLKFSDVNQYIESISNFSLEFTTEFKELIHLIKQIEIISFSYAKNLLYKLFIASYLNTKTFLNKNWKNKLIIIYLLRNIKELLVDMTDIVIPILEEIEDPNNVYQLNQLATILGTNSNEIKETLYKARDYIGEHKIQNHCKMGHKSNLILLEFISGEITQNNIKSPQRFYVCNQQDDGLQNINFKVNTKTTQNDK